MDRKIRRPFSLVDFVVQLYFAAAFSSGTSKRERNSSHVPSASWHVWPTTVPTIFVAFGATVTTCVSSACFSKYV